MFEIYAEKSEPTTRLVVRQGSGLPADLGARDWLRLGPFDADATLAAEVDRLGFAFVHSDEPIPDPARLKDADGAGA